MTYALSEPNVRLARYDNIHHDEAPMIRRFLYIANPAMLYATDQQVADLCGEVLAAKNDARVKRQVEDIYKSIMAKQKAKIAADGETKLASPLRASSLYSPYQVSDNIKKFFKKYQMSISTPSQADVEQLLRKMVVNSSKVQNWKADLDIFAAESKVNINAQDRNGKTALHLAVERNNVDYATALLEKGADRSLIDISKASISKEMLELFSALGSREEKNMRAREQMIRKKRDSSEHYGGELGYRHK